MVDLQENYRLAELVAPHVDKVRYNPGHLYHHEKEKPVAEKVRFLVDVAREHDCALRVGVNCGSVDPVTAARHPEDDVAAMVESALEHCRLLDDSASTATWCRSRTRTRARSSKPTAASPRSGPTCRCTWASPRPACRRKASSRRASPSSSCCRAASATPSASPSPSPTRASTRRSRSAGDPRRHRRRAVPLRARLRRRQLNIISCPSCSRVENEPFVELAEQVKEMTPYAEQHEITIAVMGCRVNGPGETDDADLGLWCGPNFVNLKKGERSLGAYTYDEILGRLRSELDALIAQRTTSSVTS